MVFAGRETCIPSRLTITDGTEQHPRQQGKVDLVPAGRADLLLAGNISILI